MDHLIELENDPYYDSDDVYEEEAEDHGPRGFALLNSRGEPVSWALELHDALSLMESAQAAVMVVRCSDRSMMSLRRNGSPFLTVDGESQAREHIPSKSVLDAYAEWSDRDRGTSRTLRPMPAWDLDATDDADTLRVIEAALQWVSEERESEDALAACLAPERRSESSMPVDEDEEVES